VSQLTRGRDRLTAQVQAAVAEYRANDIITIGLRDHITRLELQLKDSQQLCSQQVRQGCAVSVGVQAAVCTTTQLLTRHALCVVCMQAAVLATFEDDMLSLQTCKVDLTQQLEQLHQQHQQLQEQHGGTLQQLAHAHKEAQESQQ
jgi:DNA-binding transcriptional MerR regulator